MRQSFKRNILIGFVFILMALSFVMAFTYNPVKKVSALPVTQEEAATENVDSMKYGYNVTAGKSLLEGGLLKNAPILKPIREELYKHIEKFENNPKQKAESFKSENIREISSLYSKTLNAGVEAFGNINCVNMDLETQFGISQNKERAEAVREYYAVYYQRQERVQYVIQDSVDLRNYLSDELKRDIKNVDSVPAAKVLLEKYGTHLFTGFTYGGMMQVCNYQSSTKVGEKLETATDILEKVGAKITAVAQGNQDFSFAEQYVNGENIGNTVSKYNSTLYGGVGVTGASVDHLFSYVSGPIGEAGSYIYGKWVESINRGEHLAIIDIPYSAKAIPLWELLPGDTENISRKYRLIDAYMEMCGDKYEEYNNKYPYVDRKVGQTDNGSGTAEISGYTVQYNNITNYKEMKDSTKNNEIIKNSKIFMNYTDNISIADKKWKIISQSHDNIVNIDDAINGVFTVRDTAPNGSSFIMGLYSKDVPLKSVRFNVKTNEFFSGGNGTETDPYLISTIDDLKSLCRESGYWGYCYKLTNDIDCVNGMDIDCIGDAGNKFTGKFFGNNCAIKNFKIRNPKNNALGLFAYTSSSAMISDLRLEGVLVTNADDAGTFNKSQLIKYAGALVGYNEGSVVNCKVSDVTVAVESDNDGKTLMSVGGMIGVHAGTSEISKCAVDNSVTPGIFETNLNYKDIHGALYLKNKSGSKNDAEVFAGGLIGSTTSTGAITDCYTKGLEQIYSYLRAHYCNQYSGGLIGKTWKSITIKNCLVGSIKDIKIESDPKSSDWHRDQKETFVGSEYKDTDANGIEKNTYTNCYTIKDARYPMPTASDWLGWIELPDFKNVADKMSWEVWCKNHNSKDDFPELISQVFNDDAISVDTSKARTEYYYGQEFNISGIKVQGQYANSSNPFNIDHFSYDATDYNAKQLGEHRIIINAMGFSTTYTVIVRKIKVVGIELVSMKETFYVGDTTKREDFNVNFILENGERLDALTEQLPNIEYPTTDPVNDIKISNIKYEYGENKVEVTCNKIKGDLVVKAIEREITELKITKHPTKPFYNVGEKFIPADMEVTVRYNDNTSKIVPNSELEIIGEEISAGENTIYICYGGYKAANKAELTVTGKQTQHTVTFKNENGAVLSRNSYNVGDKIVEPETPTKPSDNVYDYTFAGWDKPVVDCEGDAVYTATYTKSYIDYKVVFNNYDGTVLSEANYHYGDKVAEPENPTKPEDKKGIYTFNGWDKEVVNCAGNITYTAVYKTTLKEYTIIFKNEDGAILSEKVYHYADPIIEPDSPTKLSDDVYDYIFRGWDKTVVNCVGDETYTAVFKSQYIEYTVTFKNDDGTVLSTTNYHYGDTIVEPVSPTKASDDDYTYTFAGWNKTVGKCEGDAEFTAVFDKVAIEKEDKKGFLKGCGSSMIGADFYITLTVLAAVVLVIATKRSKN